MPVEAIRQYIVATGSVTGFDGAKHTVDRQSVLTMECGILNPTALEGQITATNAADVKVKLVCEAANGPITFEGDEILNQRGIVVLPDAYVNAAGVTVSYFEWIRNLAHICLGHMDRRYGETRARHVTATLKSITGSKLPATVKDELVRGADELDLVRSGRDDTMALAYQQLSEELHSKNNVTDFFTVAYAEAINEIALSYLDIGVY